ncbi:ABC transporter permease [Mesomycoplasma flocculare]|uniref:ABC transporter permease n=1 Tax=Mesomycoplasma flocculare TaxID=2128 RepID=UPI0002D00BE1|nr:ABC transporter permease [Mesomycoplasma flocculare]ENX51038.1 hypothetical protein MFC_00385 [Mesomycoplasma flocculare ATCC 27716]
MIKNLINPFPFFWKKIDKISAKSSSEKIFSTLWAIFFGILISFIFIRSFGYNPLKVYNTMFFKIAFAKNEIRNLLLVTSIFVFASIAIAISFKAGLFNIGVPGQMMISGVIALIIYLNLTSINIYIRLFLGFFLGILTSGVLGFLVGILKSFLRINEVISTILINWIVYYITKFLLTSTSFEIGFKSNSPLTSQSISDAAFLSVFPTRSFSIIILFLGLLFAFLIWIVMQKTTVGLRIKIVGQNKNAATYAGINNKTMTISTMTLSGIISGIAGFIWYIFYKRSFTLANGMPREGFNAILVALLAFNSPLGIIPTSFFYSTLTIGASRLQNHSILLNQETMQIVIGIIIYLSAISVIFINFKPIRWTLNFWFLLRSKRFFDTKTQKLAFLKLEKSNFSNLNLIGIKKIKKEKIETLNYEITNLEKKKNEYLAVFLNEKINVFKLYLNIQKINIKLYFLKKQSLKIKNADNVLLWKKIKLNIKNNFGIDSNFKNKNLHEKLAFFESIAQKKRLANQELNSSGYYDLRNNFNAFKQQFIEQHLQFRALKVKIINDFRTKKNLKSDKIKEKK